MISGFFTLYFFLMIPYCESKISFGIVMFLSAFGNGLNVGGSGAALLGKNFSLPNFRPYLSPYDKQI